MESSLVRLGFDPARYKFESNGPSVPFRYQRRDQAALPIGLFYGGGIESNAALTALLPYCPNLFILEGPAWMNNDTRGDLRLKRGLEREVSTNHGLDLLYARMNRLRAIRRMRC